MEIALAPRFKRLLKKLPKALREEAREKIQLFENPANHAALRIHKLQGKLENRLSFSVNYRFRIIFQWEVPNKSAILLAIGDHAVYD